MNEDVFAFYILNYYFLLPPSFMILKLGGFFIVNIISSSCGDVIVVSIINLIFIKPKAICIDFNGYFHYNILE